MTARMRTALLAVVASLGLVSLAYGMGGVVGGGSSSAAGGSPSGAGAGPSHFRLVDATDGQSTPHKRPCRHRHDGGGGGSSDDSSTGGGTADSY